VDAVQIFDSHGGHLASSEFQEASGRWMKEIISSLTERRLQAAATSDSQSSKLPPSGGVPVIVFSLGTHGNWPDLIASGANVLGVDWQTSLADARQIIPAHTGMQGNLAPTLIVEATPEVVAAETQ
jgi:uroporphyrinogen decarboxylase